MTVDGWPAEMNAFLSRVVMHEPKSDVSVNVIQALEPQVPGQNDVAIIFDIDAYEDVSLPSNDVTIAERLVS